MATKANLNLELYTEGDAFCAYLSDDCGGSGISVKGKTPEECVEKLGEYITDYFFNEDSEDTNLCMICGERHDEEDGQWLTSSEFICDECYNKLPQWVKDAIEEVEYEFLPDKVVDYLNNELLLDFVYHKD